MTILMCRPDFFEIEYAINPWMDTDRKVDRDAAQAQWQSLYDTYIDLGVTVRLVPGVKGLPDMVFTANAGIIWGRTAIVSAFRHSERRKEEAAWRKAFADLNFRVISPPSGMVFEGAGDGLFMGTTLFCGFGFRSDPDVPHWLASALDVNVIPVELVDPRFYHLDTCFCPLDERTALYAPEAFSDKSRAAIEAHVERAIAVPPEVSALFACNATPIGRTVVGSTGLTSLEGVLADAGFGLRTLEVSEFMKSGGAVRCLSLPLDVGPVAAPA